MNFRVSTAVFWLSQRGIMVHVLYFGPQSLGVVRGSLDIIYEKITGNGRFLGFYMIFDGKTIAEDFLKGVYIAG